MADVKKLITEHLDIWLTAETAKKSGRGRSSSSSNSIYGVQKLRELIIDLAIQGKLLPLKINNECIFKLQKKIDEEIVLLIKSGDISEKQIIHTIETSYPYQIPKSWKWDKLANLAAINGGFAFKSINYSDEGIRVIRISDFNELGLKFDNIVRHQYSDNLKSFLIHSNNILMAMTGGTVGKTCFLKSIPEPLIANQRVATIKPINCINADYINLVLKSSLTQKVIEKAKNSTNDNISMGNIHNLWIPLPPLEQQQHIVAKVNELMQLCDQLEQQQNLSSEAHEQLVETLLSVLINSSDVDEFHENWQRISKNFDLLFTTEYSIDQLKQTILQLAVMGKLLKQDPNDEPVSELLEQIAEEKAKLVKEGKIKKSKPLLEISNEEKPYEIPHNWIWTRLDSLTSKIGAGSTPKGGKEVYVDSGIPFLRSQNVWNDGLALDDVAFISETTHQKMAGTHVQANDLLFNITGGSIGRCALVATNFKTANVSQHVTIVRSLHKDLASFLHLVLRSSYIQKLVMDVQVGVSREGLSIGKLSQFLIPLPSLSEQKRIIEKVEILNSIINSLQESLNKLQKNKLHLADSLVDNALSDSNKNKQTKVEAHLIEFVKPIEIVKQSKQKSADQIDLFADDSVEDDIKLLSLAAEITFQLHTEPTFGHLKLQKLIYLCQQLKNMNLVTDFKQHAAGPYDPIMARYLDKEFKNREWFSYDSKRDLKYKPLSRCNDHRSAFNRYFAEDVSEIYDLIGLFRTSKSDHIEIVATLFACWLRLLEKKLSVTEEQLLKDFYAWSEEKKRFSKAEVLTGYKWMHQYSVIPQL
ncbi:restriction endonuclease subunit S [Acinetobacter pittii]|uniref:restriction endonuclease subunit S n=1 Tax=Acinetobacter pittii TaxID=48296 RepID=UPI00301B6FDB